MRWIKRAGGAAAGRLRPAKPFRRPRIKATGNRRLAAAAFRRDVQPRDAGVADQACEIGGVEEQRRLGMNRVKRFLRQGVTEFAAAGGQRGQRRRAKDRDANIGEPV